MEKEIVNQLPKDWRKPFIPKLSPHAQIYTVLSVFVALSCIQIHYTHTHMVRHLSLSLTHTHIQSSLQTNALLIKY